MSKRITCGYCGEEIRKNAKKCPHCSKEFKERVGVKTEKGVKLKKIFLITLTIALSISALIGIYIFVFGNFREIEGKLLMTTLAIGGFSVTAL